MLSPNMSTVLNNSVILENLWTNSRCHHSGVRKASRYRHVTGFTLFLYFEHNVKRIWNQPLVNLYNIVWFTYIELMYVTTIMYLRQVPGLKLALTYYWNKIKTSETSNMSLPTSDLFCLITSRMHVRKVLRVSGKIEKELIVHSVIINTASSDFCELKILSERLMNDISIMYRISSQLKIKDN